MERTARFQGLATELPELSMIRAPLLEELDPPEDSSFDPFQAGGIEMENQPGAGSSPIPLLKGKQSVSIHVNP